MIKLYNKKKKYKNEKLLIKILDKQILMFIIFIDVEINVVKFAILNWSVFKLVIIYNNVSHLIIK